MERKSGNEAEFNYPPNYGEAIGRISPSFAAEVTAFWPHQVM